MDPLVAWELLAVVLLILANGFFATAEIALVSVDRERLEELAKGGDVAATSALELTRDSQRWLPIVRTAISFFSTLAGAIAAVQFVPWFAAYLPQPDSALWQLAALLLIVMIVTLLSVIVGELAPQRVALHYALPMARLVARPLLMMAQLARPLLWLTGRSTDLLAALVGARGKPPASVTISAIENLIEQGTEAGIVEPLEQRLALEALRLGEQQVRQIMRPRVEIDAADVETPPEEILGVLAMAGFSRIPVYEGDLDHILGIVHLKDVLRQHYLGWDIALRKLLHPALFVPDSLQIDRLLALFHERREHMAIVVDEFGATRGMVTMEDVLRELIGDLSSSPAAKNDTDIVQRSDGSWLVDGKVSIEDMLTRLGREQLMDHAPKLVNTVAGLVLTELNHIPRTGEKTTWHDLQLEVVDMDGQRIDRILISQAPTDEPPADET